MMAEDVNADDLDYVQLDDALIERAVDTLNAVKKRGLKVVTAESCTGGLVALVLTEAPGAADFFQGAFITYTPEQKCAALGIGEELIERHGAVSHETARAMVEGALRCSEADLAVSVTGVAGPNRDEKGKPVGLVYVAAGRRGGEITVAEKMFGDAGRSRVRYRAACEALALLKQVAET